MGFRRGREEGEDNNTDLVDKSVFSVQGFCASAGARVANPCGMHRLS